MNGIFFSDISFQIFACIALFTKRRYPSSELCFISFANCLARHALKQVLLDFIIVKLLRIKNFKFYNTGERNCTLGLSYS